MSRRIRRDMHKRVSSSGYQQIQGDLEVQGNILGPTVTGLASAIAKLSATSTTPVQLSAPEATGGLRSVTLRWSRQYNLSNFSHYELQVSDDDLAWYSLVLDGSGWGGNLNEDTDAKVEFFDHPNIPLEQSGGDLVGKKLYYRVRQVTIAGVKSAWSGSASATTKPVPELVLTDSLNRYIEISSHKGIYADDRQGHIIHDIPNSPMLTGMRYGGHILWFNAITYIDSAILTYTDVETARNAGTGTLNATISEHLPTGLTNVKGAVLAIHTVSHISAAKTHVGAYLGVQSNYSTSYNTTPGSTAYMSLLQSTYTGADHAANHYAYYVSPPIVPVVFSPAGVPYVTWNATLVVNGMSADSALYGSILTVYLLGVCV